LQRIGFAIWWPQQIDLKPGLGELGLEAHSTSDDESNFFNVDALFNVVRMTAGCLDSHTSAEGETGSVLWETRVLMTLVRCDVQWVGAISGGILGGKWLEVYNSRCRSARFELWQTAGGACQRRTMFWAL
jgi:hypothetical protein